MDITKLVDHSLVPDYLIRVGIRRLLARRLRGIPAADNVGHGAYVEHFADQLRRSPLAVATSEANEQHYEVPAEFFQAVLGPRMKYSCCHYETPRTPLPNAEEAMLQKSCERAELEDGMRVLELGCGWGSLTLWIAEHFPGCRLTAVSNSNSQRKYIENCAESRGLENLNVITADMRNFSTDETFDRVVSIEMFEHMRNYELLLRRVSQWLKEDGKAFVHIFCHHRTPYLFESEGTANWMGRHFFTGGMMPSEDLFRKYEDAVSVEKQWRVNGLHYWRTCEDWLKNLDRNRSRIAARFCQDLSPGDAKRTLQRWRIFLMACSELFRYRNGNEWFVGHYLFRNVRSRSLPDQSAREQKAALA